jgi:hypothetical protein
LRRLLIGLLVLATGLFLGLGDLFLAVWTARSNGEHDIAARGPWLLAMFIPYLASLVALVTVCVALATGRRVGAWPVRLALGIVAAGVMGILLYADPSATVWRVLAPGRRMLGEWGTYAADVALLILAAALLRASSGKSEVPVARAV